MKTLLRPSVVLALLPSLAPAQEPARVEALRARIVEVAEAYRDVVWTATAEHALHGPDSNGVHVDTPDVAVDPAGWKPGAENVGMPYCWGGFTSLEAFEAELARGRIAGHVPNRGNALPSAETIGLDCSGFVSRAWELPLKQSTRSLGALCYELSGYDELLPGDIVNRYDSHVALFTGWADEARTTMKVIESARLRVEDATYTLADLEARGFRPMRYKPLDARWVDMTAPAGETTLGAEGLFEPGDASAPELEELENPLDASSPGDWARYLSRGGRLEREATFTWLVARADGAGRELQCMLDVDRDSLATGVSWEGPGSLLDALIAFAQFSDPLVGMKVVTGAVEAGEWRAGEHVFPAYRVALFLEGNSLSRSTHYPAELAIDAVISPALPGFGLCEVSYDLTVDWGSSGENRMISQVQQEFTLQAFGPGGA